MEFYEFYYYASTTFGVGIYAFALIAYLLAWEALNNKRQEADLTFPYTNPVHH